MPLACSSQRLTKRQRKQSRFIIFLPCSRMRFSVRLAIRRASILVIAPTFSRDRHAVVVEDHEHVGLDVAAVVQRLERHAGAHRAVADHRDDLALVAAALVRDRHAERGADRRRRMADAERVVLAFLALRERREAVLLLDRRDAVAAAGQDLVRIALMADVPDEAVARRIEEPVQRDRELDDAEARRRSGRPTSPPIRSGRRAAPARHPRARLPEPCGGLRAFRCARDAGSGWGRSSDGAGLLSAHCPTRARARQGRPDGRIEPIQWFGAAFRAPRRILSGGPSRREARS